MWMRHQKVTHTTLTTTTRWSPKDASHGGCTKKAECPAGDVQPLFLRVGFVSRNPLKPWQFCYFSLALIAAEASS